MINIMLTGYIEKLDGDVHWRARVSGLGVHAYGKTNDEARQRAEAIALMKMELWDDYGVLDQELERRDIPFWRHDEPAMEQRVRDFQMDMELAYA